MAGDPARIIERRPRHAGHGPWISAQSGRQGPTKIDRIGCDGPIVDDEGDVTRRVEQTREYCFHPLRSGHAVKRIVETDVRRNHVIERCQAVLGKQFQNVPVAPESLFRRHSFTSRRVSAKKSP
jgi:hypothetical protein